MDFGAQRLDKSDLRQADQGKAVAVIMPPATHGRALSVIRARVRMKRKRTGALAEALAPSISRIHFDIRYSKL